MPTYSYACTNCDNKFDIQQSFSDDALTTCPECEGRLRKLFNSVGIVFKGSGFYRNDSRSTTSSSESADSGKSDSSSSKSESSKSDSSGAKKSESGSSSSSSSSSSSAAAKA